MPTNERDLLDLVINGVHLVDAVFRRLSVEIASILEPYTGRSLTHGDRVMIRRLMDYPLARVFGLTQRMALVSELFTTILQATDAAAERPFRRMIDRTRAVIERRDPAWWQRIRRKAQIDPSDPFLRALRALDGPVVDRQRFLRAGLLDPQRRWVPRDRWNTSTGYRLSDRIWHQGQDARRGIDALLREGIAEGTDALEIAKELERYLNPAYQSQVYRKDGKIVRRNMTTSPRNGWGNYAARRLARTEVTRVHGAASLKANAAMPGCVGSRWRLSGSHPKPDQCDMNARNSSPGLPPGVYAHGQFPQYPSHPHDLCSIVPEMASRDAVIDELAARYGGI